MAAKKRQKLSLKAVMTKTSRIISLGVLIASILFIPYGCDLSCEGGCEGIIEQLKLTDTETTATTPPSGSTTAPSGGIPGPVVGSGTIGLSGGTVEVTDQSGPLYGAKVEIPEGALDEEILVEMIEDTNPPPLSAEIIPVSAIIRLEPDGTLFNYPVTITINYNVEMTDVDDLIVPLTYSETEDYWYVPFVADIDRTEGTVEILTTHFSHILVSIIDRLSGWENPPEFDTGFRPDIHGFPPNFMNTGGWCAGMACFSKWLFLNYPECKGLRVLDKSILQQIASEAESLTYEASLLTQIKTAHRARFTWDDFLYITKREMAKSNSPIEIAQWYNPPVQGKDPHTLLAYKYEGDTIWYYDVNKPDQELQLTSTEYNQAGIDYAVMKSSELYSSRDFEQLFNKYKDVLCEEEGWCFSFFPNLPVIHLRVEPVEIFYIDVEDFGDPAPFEIDIDLSMLEEMGGFEVVWGAPLPQDRLCIPVERDDDNIHATFSYVHQPTGCDISAELNGTIQNDIVSFTIDHYLPPELQNFEEPLSYSDCLSDLEGTVTYSLPAVLTVYYEGIISDDKIVGTFTSFISGIYARWLYSDKEYSCAWGTTREEMNFDGIVQWTFSDMDVSGSFEVDIGD